MPCARKGYAMRKLLIVLLASVILLSACGKGVEDVTTAVTTSPITDSVTTTEAPAETTVTQNEPKIELVTRTESIGSVQGSTRTYVYPSVTIEDNSELSAKIKLHIPDENSRRVGQSVAAASLPEIK